MSATLPGQILFLLGKEYSDLTPVVGTRVPIRLVAKRSTTPKFCLKIPKCAAMAEEELTRGLRDQLCPVSGKAGNWPFSKMRPTHAPRCWKIRRRRRRSIAFRR